MTIYTKELRQEIIRDFAVRQNDGKYDPRLFYKHVLATGRSHPAYDWFDSADKAKEEHWLWQARQFASGLRISFKVEEMRPSGKLSVREVQAPFAISPVAGRREGGGYVIVDHNSPAHMLELCHQGAVDLQRWLNRYEAAVAYAGSNSSAIRKLISELENAAPKGRAA